MSRCRERYTNSANIFFLVCNRESEHPGIHRDNVVGLYWHKTAPPLEWIELPPAPPDCICHGAGVQPNCLAHGSADSSSGGVL